MNVLFCHDGPLSFEEEHGYHSIGFHDRLMDRYAQVFGKVSIVTRVDRSRRSVYNESNKLTAEKYPVIEYPNYLTLKGIFANKRGSTQQLEETIRGCDGLIIRLPSFLGSKCFKLAEKYKKPVLVEMVGCPWDSLRNHSLTGKLLAPYLWLRTRLQVHRATDVLSVTDKFLQGRYPTAGRQIACSDVELPSSDACPVRSKQSDPKKLRLGTLGVIDVKYKGHATVIEAIAELTAQGYDIEYQIVGPGDRSSLEACCVKHGVRDNVVFLGQMDHDEIFNWLETVDVYIQPSLTEGMPRALIEAMSKGCPCVASNAGGMPELLPPQYIFPKGKAAKLAAILRSAHQNGLLEQGQRNRSFTQQFSQNVITERRSAFYQAFLHDVMRQNSHE